MAKLTEQRVDRLEQRPSRTIIALSWSDHRLCRGAPAVWGFSRSPRSGR